jgi:hypothetical protein
MLRLDQGSISQRGIDVSLQNNQVQNDEVIQKIPAASKLTDGKSQLIQQRQGFKVKINGYKKILKAIKRRVSNVLNIKAILKTGGKFGFGVAKEMFKQGGIENYAKQQAVEQSHKIGSYVANKVADPLKEKFAGNIRQYSSHNEQFKPNTINIIPNIKKSKGFRR